MSSQQKRMEFFENGFMQVRNALPEEAVTKMAARIWEAIEERHNIYQNNPDSWIEGSIRGIGDLNREAIFRPFGSPAIFSIIDDLLGKNQWKPPPSWGQILATFPAKEWSWNSLLQNAVEISTIMWHTDYPYNTVPGELPGVQIFCLLADIESGGGGTLIIKRSHRVIENFVRKQTPETLQKMKRARLALLDSHPWFQSVSKAISLPRPETWIAEQKAIIDGVNVSVVELTGKAGDVYFTHPWLLHAPSPNCNTTPRLMCTQRIHKYAEKKLNHD